jgi:hypothetical protein
MTSKNGHEEIYRHITKLHLHAGECEFLCLPFSECSSVFPFLCCQKQSCQPAISLGAGTSTFPKISMPLILHI